MFHSACFSLLVSLQTQHNFYISLLLPSHEEEQVAREGGVVVIAVMDQCIGPQLHIDHISHLQQNINDTNHNQDKGLGLIIMSSRNKSKSCCLVKSDILLSPLWHWYWEGGAEGFT